MADEEQEPEEYHVEEVPESPGFFRALLLDNSGLSGCSFKGRALAVQECRDHRDRVLARDGLVAAEIREESERLRRFLWDCATLVGAKSENDVEVILEAVRRARVERDETQVREADARRDHERAMRRADAFQATAGRLTDLLRNTRTYVLTEYDRTPVGDRMSRWLRILLDAVNEALDPTAPKPECTCEIHPFGDTCGYACATCPVHRGGSCVNSRPPTASERGACRTCEPGDFYACPSAAGGEPPQDRSEPPAWAAGDEDGPYVVVENTPGKWPPDEADKIAFLWQIDDSIRADECRRHAAGTPTLEAYYDVCYALNEYCNGAPRDGRITRALERARDRLDALCNRKTVSELVLAAVDRAVDHGGSSEIVVGPEDHGEAARLLYDMAEEAGDGEYSGFERDEETGKTHDHWTVKLVRRDPVAAEGDLRSRLVETQAELKEVRRQWGAEVRIVHEMLVALGLPENSTHTTAMSRIRDLVLLEYQPGDRVEVRTPATDHWRPAIVQEIRKDVGRVCVRMTGERDIPDLQFKPADIRPVHDAPEPLKGFPLGHLIAAIAAWKQGEEPAAESMRALEAWRRGT